MLGRVCLFGDEASFLEDGVIGAYRAPNGISLTEDESVFNAYLAKQRIAVEWGFGKVVRDKKDDRYYRPEASYLYYSLRCHVGRVRRSAW